jgi:hypothetical protein
MSKRMKIFLSFLSFTLFLYVVLLTITLSNIGPVVRFAGPVHYRGPFKGRVLDQNTRQPIEGVVVHVDWLIDHINAPSFFDASEMVTDKDGNFYISSNWSINPLENIAMRSQILIFKAGYGFYDSLGGVITHYDAEFINNLSEDNRRKGGFGYYYKIEFEGDLPIFLLKKVTYSDINPNASTDPVPSPDKRGAEWKRSLIMKEFDKERKANYK